METKYKLGAQAIGRKPLQHKDGFELKEAQSSYKRVFEVKKGPLKPNNVYDWDNYSEISGGKLGPTKCHGRKTANPPMPWPSPQQCCTAAAGKK